jgi:hypothetical protein
VFDDIHPLKSQEESKEILLFLEDDEAELGKSTKDESQYFSCMGLK